MAKQIFKNILDVGVSEVLRKLGFQKLDNLRRILADAGESQEVIDQAPDMDLYLIPAEKYDEIPAGYPLIDIFGQEMKFKKGESDNDEHCGCLPYGVLRPAEPEVAAEHMHFVLNKDIVLHGRVYKAGMLATEAAMLDHITWCNYDASDVMIVKLPLTMREKATVYVNEHKAQLERDIQDVCQVQIKDFSLAYDDCNSTDDQIVYIWAFNTDFKVTGMLVYAVLYFMHCFALDIERYCKNN